MLMQKRQVTMGIFSISDLGKKNNLKDTETLMAWNIVSKSRPQTYKLTPQFKQQLKFI